MGFNPCYDWIFEDKDVDPNGIFGLLQNVTVKGIIGDYLEENVGGSASVLTLGLMCCIL